MVRDRTDSLCYHVDAFGQRIYSTPQTPFLDLDVFHKGFARARDERGWFFIDVQGQDIGHGRRYQQIEPFYNGHALVQDLHGTRCIINEQGEVANTIGQPEVERLDSLQKVSISITLSLSVGCV